MRDKRITSLEYASRSGAASKPSISLSIFIASIGSILLVTGSIWLYRFVLTDYRAHQRETMIPIGIVSTAIGLWFLYIAIRRLTS